MDMALLQECSSNTTMMPSKVEKFWRLERVGVEESAFYLQKDMVTVGRKIKINHKPCNGPNVSRNHLKFVRASSTLDCSSRQDWRKVTWSVRDLGTVAGSYVNGVQIEPRTSYSLKCGDIIGVGCPLSYSVKKKDFESFVYRIHAPEMVEIKKEFEEDDEMPLIITNIESCQAYETKSKDEKKKEKKDKKRRKEKMRSDMQSSLKTSSISEKECSYENGNHSSCSLRASDLVDGLRILKRIGDYFCPGRLVDISPPDIYGIVVDKERGNKPHIFSQEEVLQEAVMEIKPTSVSELKVGDRVCVFWSSKMSYLHPGAVAGFDGDENFAIIQLDDGDSRDIHIDQIRYLPQNYPLIVPEQVSFTGLFGSRKRVSSTVMKKLKTEETV